MRDNEKIRARILEALEEVVAAGGSEQKLVTDVKLAPTFYRDLRDWRKKSIRVDSLIKIAPGLKRTIDYLITGKGESRPPIKVASFAGAGAEVYEIDEELDRVFPLADAPEDAFAIIVRGDSQEPVFIEGDVLICAHDHAENLLYRYAVVTLDDERSLLKQIVPGTRPGRYTLRSANKDVEDMIDVKIKTVARVLWRKIA